MKTEQNMGVNEQKRMWVVIKIYNPSDMEITHKKHAKK